MNRGLLMMVACVSACFCLLGCQTVGPGVQIPPRTQQVLAIQSSQARLCVGLGGYLKSLTTVGAREKDEGAKLYNDAVVKNDAVVEQLKAQLLTAGVKQLAVNEEMSKDAIASLSRFREFVEATAKLSNVRPLDPDSILKEIGQTRDGGLIVAGVVLGAVRAAEWWYAENGRARDALRAQLDTFRMPPWHELHAPGDPPK